MGDQLQDLPFSLDETCPIAWQSSVEEQLHPNYPFSDQEKTPENFVIRRYLETLWLPESFNPLSHLIISLKRIGPSKETIGDDTHPLHSLLESLLLTTRAATDKYHKELVEILENGEGGGGPEEGMMWYAWEHEKFEGGGDEVSWRKQWLERLEHREAMIQILVSMLKLSLPRSNPSVRGRSQKRRKKGDVSVETDEERLENFMDRLAVWQLTSSLDIGLTSSQGSSHGNSKSDRHWTQVFCEDVVEKLFKADLPEQCMLLRSKVFPTSPFSDAEESDDDIEGEGGRSRAGSRAPSLPRKVALHREASVASQRDFQRHRSRSLSISLANDQVSQRASVVESKRALSREVSMNVAFKEKVKARTKGKAKETMQQSKLRTVASKTDTGVTLIAETPAKRKHPETMLNNRSSRVLEHSFRQHLASSVPSPPPTSSSPGGIIIEDTPAISRTQPMANLQAGDHLLPLSPLSSVEEQEEHDYPAKLKGQPAFAKARSKSHATEPIDVDEWQDENADESFNVSFGSPDVLLLGSDNEAMVNSSPLVAAKKRKPFALKRLGSNLSSRMTFGLDVEMDTPTKKRARRR